MTRGVSKGRLSFRTGSSSVFSPRPAMRRCPYPPTPISWGGWAAAEGSRVLGALGTAAAPGLLLVLSRRHPLLLFTIRQASCPDGGSPQFIAALKTSAQTLGWTGAHRLMAREGTLPCRPGMDQGGFPGQFFALAQSARSPAVCLRRRSAAAPGLGALGLSGGGRGVALVSTGRVTATPLVHVGSAVSEALLRRAGGVAVTPARREPPLKEPTWGSKRRRHGPSKTRRRPIASPTTPSPSPRCCCACAADKLAGERRSGKAKNCRESRLGPCPVGKGNVLLFAINPMCASHPRVLGALFNAAMNWANLRPDKKPAESEKKKGWRR